MTNRVTLYNKTVTAAHKGELTHLLFRASLLRLFPPLFGEVTMKAAAAESTNSLTPQLLFTTVGLVFSTLLIS